MAHGHPKMSVSGWIEAVMLGPQTPDRLPDQTGQVYWPGACLASQGISFNQVITGPGPGH